MLWRERYDWYASRRQNNDECREAESSMRCSRERASLLGMGTGTMRRTRGAEADAGSVKHTNEINDQKRACLASQGLSGPPSPACRQSDSQTARTPGLLASQLQPPSQARGHRHRGGNTSQVVPTASHASSSGRGASATAGPSPEFPFRATTIDNTILTVPEDVHRNIDDTTPQSASANPRVLAPSFQPPYPTDTVSPRPRRWSLRNAFAPLAPPPPIAQGRHGLPSHSLQIHRGTGSSRFVRPRTGGRLWNPTNSTPRVPRPRSPDLEAVHVVPLPLQHPQIGGDAVVGNSGGDYPLLTLQEQRQSRHSGTGTPRASLQVEYNSSASGSTRISLPRSVSLDIRRSTDVEPNKGKGKAVEFEGEHTSTGDNRKGGSISGPPVALQQKVEALERKQNRKKDKGKGRAIEIDLAMASPDLEQGTLHHLKSSVDRAAEPTNRSTTSLSQHSGIGPPLSSEASSIHGSAHDVVLPGEDAEWGPSHPCYPHLNPHVPTTSPLYQSTRILRVRRDWILEGDLAPTFSGLYPEVLADAGLGEGEFRRVIESVNNQLISTFNPFNWRNVLDAVLGLVTGWIWDDFGFTAAKSRLKKVEQSLETWNQDIEREAGVGVGARFVPLRKSGYMTLDIQIPTPQIHEVGGDEASERRPTSADDKPLDQSPS